MTGTIVQSFMRKFQECHVALRRKSAKLQCCIKTAFLCLLQKMILLAIVGINKSSKFPSFTMWDNSVQDSYIEFNPLTVDDA